MPREVYFGSSFLKLIFKSVFILVMLLMILLISIIFFLNAFHSKRPSVLTIILVIYFPFSRSSLSPLSITGESYIELKSILRAWMKETAIRSQNIFYTLWLQIGDPLIIWPPYWNNYFHCLHAFLKKWHNLCQTIINMVKKILALSTLALNLCVLQVIFNAWQMVCSIHLYGPCKFVLFLIMKPGEMILEAS